MEDKDDKLIGTGFVISGGHSAICLCSSIRLSIISTSPAYPSANEHTTSKAQSSQDMKRQCDCSNNFAFYVTVDKHRVVFLTFQTMRLKTQIYALISGN